MYERRCFDVLHTPVGQSIERSMSFDKFPDVTCSNFLENPHKDPGNVFLLIYSIEK